MAFGKPKAEFEITAENKTGCAFKQVHSELNRMTTVARNLNGPLTGPCTGAPPLGQNQAHLLPPAKEEY